MGQIISAFIKSAGVLMVATALLLGATIFSIVAASKITSVSGYQGNSLLQSAHGRLTAASIVGSIGVALIITAIVIILVSIVLSEGTLLALLPLVNIGIWILGIAALGLMLFVGIEDAIAASDIQKANVSNDNDTFLYTMIAIFLTLGAIGLVILFYIIKIIVREHKKSVTILKEHEQELAQLEQRRNVIAARLKASQADLESYRQAQRTNPTPQAAAAVQQQEAAVSKLESDWVFVNKEVTQKAQDIRQIEQKEKAVQAAQSKAAVTTQLAAAPAAATVAATTPSVPAVRQAQLLTQQMQRQQPPTFTEELAQEQAETEALLRRLEKMEREEGGPSG